MAATPRAASLFQGARRLGTTEWATFGEVQGQGHPTGVGVGQEILSTSQVRQLLKAQAGAPHREVISSRVGLKTHVYN